MAPATSRKRKYPHEDDNSVNGAVVAPPTSIVNGPPAEDAVIYRSPGLVPDARLKVFDREFHVHSVPLGNEQKISAFEDYQFEREAFQDLLSAIYNRPYTIHHLEQLKKIVSLADFYCALPILSSTIINGLISSDMYESATAGDNTPSDFAFAAPDLIHAAYKLRHPILFRECLIHVVGQWQSITDEQMRNLEENIAIYRLIVREVTYNCRMIMEASQKVMRLLSERCPIQIGREDYPGSGIDNPELLRAVHTGLLKLENPKERHQNIIEVLKADIKGLLTNNLFLDRSGFAAGEDGPHRFYFLCAYISDEEMPWDAESIDW
ncbi:hypothetical protein D0Z07_0338 [Hyphodiscus hymeniophilus]|uniref:BTB domain-containing protein n=1 Tax=Hyphodiscus hymeniophilus TaxID=353542 RepID=A0A9P6VRV7_9HELO|nr:hypothetical protein D0Z07_0338 [Hyphodiscus hymeniophilus]